MPLLRLFYGGTAASLAAELKISHEKAQSLITKIFDLYPKLEESFEEITQCGMARGYASTVTGLRRKIPQGCSDSSWVRNFLRNTPIQGNAAIVFKRALIDLYHEFVGTEVKVILTIHDSFVIECHREARQEVIAKAKLIMEGAMRSFFPTLKAQIRVTDKDPTCWNKNGDGKSLEKMVGDE